MIQPGKGGAGEMRSGVETFERLEGVEGGIERGKRSKNKGELFTLTSMDKQLSLK